MNILQLYQDYNIPHPSDGERHFRPGWINTRCPFCKGGHDGYHLGFELNNPHYFCWRCGWHPVGETVAELLSIPESEVKNILRQYRGEGIITQAPRRTQKTSTLLNFPSNTGRITQPHQRYLLKRKFDPNKIEQIFKIQGTGPVSRLKHGEKSIDYRHRIIIPIPWDNRAVSFDSRDISDRHSSKYMACPAELEIIGHKDILYGVPLFWGDTGICVEGYTDVWRFGVKSFSVSGIEYTPAQVRWMNRLFKRVFVVFDKEPQAQAQAKKLVSDLRFRGVWSENIMIESDDPGSMDQDEADYFVRQLIK